MGEGAELCNLIFFLLPGLPGSSVLLFISIATIIPSF